VPFALIYKKRSILWIVINGIGLGLTFAPHYLFNSMLNISLGQAFDSISISL
jgi:hypothetical protein